MKKSILVLSDGTTFEGEALGAEGTTLGEAVFSTCMTGYQEMLTDPSFAGQLLTMTYPLIGNYGVASEDFESRGVQVAGFIIKHLCEHHSNWRSVGSLDEFLAGHGVVGIKGIDTRKLTRHLRVRGVMMGAVSTEATPEELLKTIEDSPNYGLIDFVRRVSVDNPYLWQGQPVSDVVPSADGGDQPHVALYDFGVKYNIMRNLASRGLKVTVYPCDYPAEAILETDPDGIVFSPGPGDPARLDYAIENVKKCIGKKPIMGICLGHQLLGRAFGSETYKLKFGHRGGNHPVQDVASGRVYITSQNHGYAVDPDGLKGSAMEVAHINLNDGTVEGMRHRELPIFSVQYHPEASPGPMDSGYLFNQFVETVAAA